MTKNEMENQCLQVAANIYNCSEQVSFGIDLSRGISPIIQETEPLLALETLYWELTKLTSLPTPPKFFNPPQYRMTFTIPFLFFNAPNEETLYPFYPWYLPGGRSLWWMTKYQPNSYRQFQPEMVNNSSSMLYGGAFFASHYLCRTIFSPETLAKLGTLPATSYIDSLTYEPNFLTSGAYCWWRLDPAAPPGEEQHRMILYVELGQDYMLTTGDLITFRTDYLSNYFSLEGAAIHPSLLTPHQIRFEKDPRRITIDCVESYFVGPFTWGQTYQHPTIGNVYPLTSNYWLQEITLEVDMRVCDGYDRPVADYGIPFEYLWSLSVLPDPEVFGDNPNIVDYPDFNPNYIQIPYLFADLFKLISRGENIDYKAFFATARPKYDLNTPPEPISISKSIRFHIDFLAMFIPGYIYTVKVQPRYNPLKFIVSNPEAFPATTISIIRDLNSIQGAIDVSTGNLSTVWPPPDPYSRFTIGLEQAEESDFFFHSDHTAPHLSVGFASVPWFTPALNHPSFLQTSSLFEYSLLVDSVFYDLSSLYRITTSPDETDIFAPYAPERAPSTTALGLETGFLQISRFAWGNQIVYPDGSLGEITVFNKVLNPLLPETLSYSESWIFVDTGAIIPNHANKLSLDVRIGLYSESSPVVSYWHSTPASSSFQSQFQIYNHNPYSNHFVWVINTPVEFAARVTHLYTLSSIYPLLVTSLEWNITPLQGYLLDASFT
jgi:hypothetical protein